MNSLTVFACAFLDEQLASIPTASHLVKVNLARLDLGEYQNNQLCEHRLFLSDLPQNAPTEYVGCVTWRWEDKYSKLIGLKELPQLSLSPELVYAAFPTRDWMEVSVRHHVGMDKYLHELTAVTGLPLSTRTGFWSNQFICHASVYLQWQTFFRKYFEIFHRKYGFNYDFWICPEHKNRHAGAFYERFSSLYFSNRKDLKIVPIPARDGWQK